MTLLTRSAATDPGSGDRIIFEKIIQVLRFGCSYESIADCACSATTIRDRRDEWIKAGIFAKLAPGGGECAGRSAVDRGKLGKCSSMVEGHGIPIDRVLARRTGTTPRCWPPRWTNSMTSDRCPMMADTIITVRSLIRQAWTAYRWDGRLTRRP
jgi:hypothetical protein